MNISKVCGVTLMMNELIYVVRVDGEVAIETEDVEFALIFVEGLLDRYYADTEMTITIKREEGHVHEKITPVGI